MFLGYCTFLPPANEVCKGYVFTPVWLFTGGGGRSLHPGGSISGGVGQTPCHWILRDTVNEQAVCILLKCIFVFIIITGRNEVVAKVIFLHLSVILFMGGVCLSACWDTTPLEQAPHREQTPTEQTPSRTRHPLDQTPPRPDTPQDQTPPRD